MALTKCKECGHDVSTTAKTCPICGAKSPIQKMATNFASGCLAIFILFIIFGIAVSTCDDKKSSNPDDWKTEDNSIMAYLMMEDFVKQRLKSPGSAKFPGVLEKENHITRMPDNKYRIISWVDSQNTFGAMIRVRFNGVIQQKNNDNWQLISLELYE